LAVWNPIPELAPVTTATVPVVTEGLVLGVHHRHGLPFPHGLTTSGLRVGGYKLIRYANGDAELYDLMADPNELDSVWGDPAYATVQRAMSRLWRQYRECRADECRVPLPESLRTDPGWLAQQDRHARSEKRAYYDTAEAPSG
jgi:hypothetical protein